MCIFNNWIAITLYLPVLYKLGLISNHSTALGTGYIQTCLVLTVLTRARYILKK